ncbi:MAG: S-adenosylmethionine:tRNA ribosyltransferase-isomerase [Flavobacteriales bacterium]|nr:S-adenosylmethionine:tRNA ribosyltransferase-isomerase [Flavobacteriales bacterium]MCC6938630.1 S-adenosylmethionine:tRNA ribosyltransferase-isomerase [Flavobacteriales bacterium]
MHPRHLSIADLTYELPESRIAQQPLAERDASRLLVYRSGSIEDRFFHELPGVVPANALLVLNDTRVVNARLIFHRSTGARIEVLCLEPERSRPVEQAFADRGSGSWKCFIGNAKRWKEGEVMVVEQDGLKVKAMRNGDALVHFTWEPAERTFAEVLEVIGHVPLPPYMKRPDAAADKERYNTVFAKHDGSVAAPTASLHLTERILSELERKGVKTMALTLHVGAGTFLPVKSAMMADHAMHHEQVRVPLKALEVLADQLGKGPVVAVGTTALRNLESIYWHGVKLIHGSIPDIMDIGQWEPYDQTKPLPTSAEALDAVITRLRSSGQEKLSGWTQLLIAPGYSFRFVDGLITNFHQPQSTLLLIVAALLGPDWRSVYDHALWNDYRFLSYGDGSLLWRSDRSSSTS